MTAKSRPIRIGLSARIFHPEQGSKGIKSKTLQVLEQSVAQWVMSRDVMVLMIPSVLQDGLLIRSNIRLRDYAEYLDGLILQGGTDVSPRAYGEDALHVDWTGDAVRDAYELELLHEFMEAGKPVLGICRGMQLINVALGGSLYQDIPSQYPEPINHESVSYDKNVHDVRFSKEGLLYRWFGNLEGGKVVSIHHQGINRLGKDIVVEATAEDGMIEAISWKEGHFVCGVQWHPEFHTQSGCAEILDCMPLLEAFLIAANNFGPT